MTHSNFDTKNPNDVYSQKLMAVVADAKKEGIPIRVAASFILIPVCRADDYSAIEIGHFINPTWEHLFSKLGFENYSILNCGDDVCFVFNAESKDAVNEMATAQLNDSGMYKDMGIEMKGNVMMFNLSIMDKIFKDEDERSEWMTAQVLDRVLSEVGIKL